MTFFFLATHGGEIASSFFVGSIVFLVLLYLISLSIKPPHEGGSPSREFKLAKREEKVFRKIRYGGIDYSIRKEIPLNVQRKVGIHNMTERQFEKYILSIYEVRGVKGQKVNELRKMKNAGL